MMDTKKTEKDSILEDRAKYFSSETISEFIDQDYLRIVEFLLGKERYGIEVEKIIKVESIKKLTLLPGISNTVAGIVNAHGRVITVLDLKNLLGLTKDQSPAFPSLIVVKTQKGEIGCCVDNIVGLKKVDQKTLRSDLPTLSESFLKYVKGVTADGLSILDIERLSEDEKGG